MERLIDDKTREDLKAYFVSVLRRKVEVDVYTDQKDELSEFTIQFCRELAELTDQLVINVLPHKEGRDFGITTDPFLVIGSNLGYSVIFNGTPANHEASSLLEMIKLISIGESGLSSAVKEKLKHIDKKANVRVFVTPACPYCPYSVILATAFVIEKPDMISLEVVEAQENVELSQKFNVSSVPLTIINDLIESSLVGVQSQEKVVELLLKYCASDYESIKSEAGVLVDNPEFIIELNDLNFNEALQKYEKMVVDFWADWCVPCKMMAPIFESLANEYKGRVVFAKLNTDENPQISAEFNVSSIPTLLFFQNGRQINRIVGARTQEQLSEEILSSFKLISLR